MITPDMREDSLINDSLEQQHSTDLSYIANLDLDDSVIYNRTNETNRSPVLLNNLRNSKSKSKIYKLVCNAEMMKSN